MTWWTKLSQTGRGAVAVVSMVFGAIGGAFALGAATRDAYTGHKDLPTRVEAVEAEVSELRPTVEALKAKVDSTVQVQATTLEVLRRLDRTVCRQWAETERDRQACDAR